MPSGLDYSGFADFAKKINNADKQFKQWLEAFMSEQARKLVDDIKRRTPVDTGKLKQSWKVDKIESRNGEVLAWFSSDVDYASHIEFGHAKPYKSESFWGTNFPSDSQMEDWTSNSYFESNPDWVAGRFMVRTSVRLLYQSLPDEFSKEFKKFIGG